jgi:hypothetical protein
MIRLLSRDANGTLVLRAFDNDCGPAYAILSHTWNRDNSTEFTFDDIQAGSGKDKSGYGKIEFCEKRAMADGLNHFWVDTCCINKRSEAELSEAINSMFRWYHESSRCYVFLVDVIASRDACSGTVQYEETAFRQSRWFTRGWTLQELIAPNKVEFFSVNGERLGDKSSLETMISNITGVPEQVLQGHPLTNFSVAERKSWAAQRKTTREEDIVYSLLGIFGVWMPLIYGEKKEHALKRLEIEISRVSQGTLM